LIRINAIWMPESVHFGPGTGLAGASTLRRT
jgi:hypothetical protein